MTFIELKNEAMINVNWYSQNFYYTYVIRKQYLCADFSINCTDSYPELLTRNITEVQK